MKIAIIPARGGSKRIPRKNIKLFCGKPMIAWSIAAAKASEIFDKIIVSTDDQEIAKIARLHGAEVPFIRPDELSDDQTSTIPVITHAIEWLKEYSDIPTMVCCIYATAPFLQKSDLQRGFEVLQSTNYQYALGVTSYPFPIQRAIKITPEKSIEMFQPEHFNSRSQDLEEAYHDAGQFCWGRTEAWLSGKNALSAGAAPIILPRHRVQDIDTPEDWLRAEWMFKSLQQSDNNVSDA